MLASANQNIPIVDFLVKECKIISFGKICILGKVDIKRSVNG